MGEKKNLEAENELYKGAFRTPFALLVGGPLGVVANAAYTALKVKDEIKREDDHKKFIASIGTDMPTPQQIKHAEQKAEEERKQKKLTDMEFLKSEFDNAEDPSFDDFFSLTYDGNGYLKESFRYFGFLWIDSYHHVGGRTSYLPVPDFIKKYKKCLEEGAIENKYKFMNDNVMATYCFLSDKKYYLTGMNKKAVIK